MDLSDLPRIKDRPADLLFILVIALSLLLAIGGLSGGLERRDALLAQASARKVDVVKIRKQISEGDLSAHKAMFYKKVTE
jgi:hypothetical protein